MANQYPSLAAFQHLGELFEKLEERVDELEERNEALEEKNSDLEARCAAVEARCVALEAKNVELEGTCPAREEFERVRAEGMAKVTMLEWRVMVRFGGYAVDAIPISPFFPDRVAVENGYPYGAYTTPRPGISPEGRQLKDCCGNALPHGLVFTMKAPRNSCMRARVAVADIVAEAECAVGATICFGSMVGYGAGSNDTGTTLAVYVERANALVKVGETHLVGTGDSGFVSGSFTYEEDDVLVLENRVSGAEVHNRAVFVNPQVLISSTSSDDGGLGSSSSS